MMMKKGEKSGKSRKFAGSKCFSSQSFSSWSKYVSTLRAVQVILSAVLCCFCVHVKPWHKCIKKNWALSPQCQASIFTFPCLIRYQLNERKYDFKAANINTELWKSSLRMWNGISFYSALAHGASFMLENEILFTMMKMTWNFLMKDSQQQNSQTSLQDLTSK